VGKRAAAAFRIGMKKGERERERERERGKIKVNEA